MEEVIGAATAQRPQLDCLKGGAMELGLDSLGYFVFKGFSSHDEVRSVSALD